MDRTRNITMACWQERSTASSRCYRLRMQLVEIEGVCARLRSSLTLMLAMLHAQAFQLPSRIGRHQKQQR